MNEPYLSTYLQIVNLKQTNSLTETVPGSLYLLEFETFHHKKIIRQQQTYNFLTSKPATTISESKECI